MDSARGAPAGRTAATQALPNPIPNATMIVHPTRSDPLARPRRFRDGWRRALAVLALVALATVAALSAPRSAAAGKLQALRPGAEVRLLDCLRVAVLDFTDRWGPLDPADWVTVRLANDCEEPVRHLLVDLFLRDAAGQTYGAPVWLLERGEILWPGQVKTERFAVPDAADHLPRHWAVRVRTLQRPSDLARAAQAQAEAARAARANRQAAARSVVPPTVRTARRPTRTQRPAAPAAANPKARIPSDPSGERAPVRIPQPPWWK